MQQSFKISIPKPCHENWEQMTPEAHGRFCGSCAKSVVDFTGMKSDEIKAYFIKHQNEKVCGRFQTQQLDSIVISIPRQVLFSQTQFHKMFLLALLFTMGTTLFSCSDGQKIDAVEIVDSDSHATTGMPVFARQDSTETDAPTSKKNCFVKPHIGIKTGEVVPEPVLKGDTIVVVKDPTDAIAIDTAKVK